MMITLFTFEQALADARQRGGENHLLTGNGASIDAHPPFSYTSLTDKVVERLRRPPGVPSFVITMIEEANARAASLEDTMNVLNESRHLTAYVPKLREEMIRAIADVHPSGYHALRGASLCVAARFLEEFTSFSTTNHDWLSYWSIMHLVYQDDCLEQHTANKFSDGFAHAPSPYDVSGRLVFQGQWRGRPLRFLHGALHLFPVDGLVRKLNRGRRADVPPELKDLIAPDDDMSIWHQLLIELHKGNAPLAIVGPSSPAKLQQIRSSEYLNHCFEDFSSIRGNLFTYGQSLSSQDQHIIRAIAQNPRLSRLYVGVYRGSSAEEACGLIERVSTALDRYESHLSPVFFDSSTVPMWRSHCQEAPHSVSCGEQIERPVWLRQLSQRA